MWCKIFKVFQNCDIIVTLFWTLILSTFCCFHSEYQPFPGTSWKYIHHGEGKLYSTTQLSYPMKFHWSVNEVPRVLFSEPSADSISICMQHTFRILVITIFLKARSTWYKSSNVMKAHSYLWKWFRTQAYRLYDVKILSAR